jgi:2-oxoglutarate ferredoxin oxidoreductase subunit delta
MDRIMDHWKAHLNPERCKGCGLCIAFCPKKVLAVGSRLNSKGYCPTEMAEDSQCTGCGFCAMMCPDLAIEIHKEPAR